MKQKNVWLVIAIIFVIVVILGGIYVTTDLFKSPEQLFYKHFIQSSQLLGNISYEETMKELQKQEEASLEIAGEMTVEVSSQEDTVKEVAEILNKGKIAYNIKKIGKEKTQSDITLNYDKKDIVTLNLLQNKEQYGIKIAEAYDKYVSVENNNLKALFQKLGVDDTNIPDKLETLDYYEFLNIDKKTRKHIEQTYVKVLKENISSDCYTIEKNAKTIFDGNELKTNAYKLTLTEEQIKIILEKMLETLKTDDITLDLIIEKYNEMMESYKVMGFSMEEDNITKTDLKEALGEALEELKEVNTNEKNKFEITVYAVKDGIAKIEMTIKDKENSTKFEIGMANTNDNKAMMIRCSEEDMQIDIIVTYKDQNVSSLIMIESEGTTISLKISQNIKATKNIMIEDFTKDNSVKLNDMSKKEIEGLINTISTNIIKALPNKMELLGITTTGPRLPNTVTGSTVTTIL